MTNREAINILEEVKAVDDSIYAYNPAYTVALDKAIDSLRASSNTSCGDTINRQAAIDAVMVELKRSPTSAIRAKTRLECLPARQPEIVHCKDCKHWIPYDWMFSEIWESQNMDDYPQDEISCSYCEMAMKADDYCSRAERKTNE